MHRVLCWRHNGCNLFNLWRQGIRRYLTEVFQTTRRVRRERNCASAWSGENVVAVVERIWHIVAAVERIRVTGEVFLGGESFSYERGSPVGTIPPASRTGTCGPFSRAIKAACFSAVRNSVQGNLAHTRGIPPYGHRMSLAQALGIVLV